MRCSNCNNEIQDGASYCPVCGQMFDYTQPYVIKSTKISNNADISYYEGKMKWFKFIIWVQLFLNCAISLYNGIQFLTGSIYGGKSSANAVYSVFSGLKTLDCFVGIAYLVLAVCAIIVRFMLSGYKKNGPTLYIGLLVVHFILGIIYVAGFMGITGLSSAYSALGIARSSIIFNILLIVININYFRERKALFVN